MTSTMTREQAQALRTAHDTDARLLSRKPKHELVAIARSEDAAIGHQRLYGGPSSKEEYVSAILNLRYPIVRLNEAIHVLHHDGGGWSACEWCQCQQTWTVLSGMVPGHDQLLQCSLPPNHTGSHESGHGAHAIHYARRS